MKTAIRSALALTALALAGVTSVNTAQAANPIVVPSSFSVGYMPNGFDDNDQVQFAAEGTLYDSCHKPAAKPKIDVDLSARRIHVTPQALRYAGPCLDVVTPYSQVIDVGILPPGNYAVSAGASRRVIGQLPVTMATSAAPDDYLYAPINQAFYRRNTARHAVILTGEFSNSCFSFKETKVRVYQNVITVQPIAELSSSRSHSCRPGRFPFERVAELPRIAPGRYLLHVRSLNSTAVNSLINIE